MGEGIHITQKINNNKQTMKNPCQYPQNKNLITALAFLIHSKEKVKESKLLKTKGDKKEMKRKKSQIVLKGRRGGGKKRQIQGQQYSLSNDKREWGY